MKHETILIRGTLAEQITAWCEHRRQDIGALTTDSPADIDTDELIIIWDQLDRFAREFSVWVRDIAVEVGHRLDDTEDHQIEHRTVGLLAGNRSQSAQWDGMAVLSGLSQPVVDGNGERIDAVPTEVLEQVLPGVGGVSSRWNVTGLPDQLRKHRTVKYGPTLPRRTT